MSDDLEVEVWLVPSVAGDERLIGALAPELRARAQRLADDRDRATFVSGRLALARLAATRGLPEPRQRCPHCGDEDHGPLSLAGAAISLSRRRGLTAIALSRPALMAVDLELARAGWEEVLPLLAAEEQQELLILPPAGRQAGFYRLWTCKEAYLKALGCGLELPLDSFVISEGNEGEKIIDVPGWSFNSRHLGEVTISVAAETSRLIVILHDQPPA